jgi:hypothetical protein
VRARTKGGDTADDLRAALLEADWVGDVLQLILAGEG